MKLGDFEHLKYTHPPIGILAIYFGLRVFLWESAECSSKVLSVTGMGALKALKPWENAHSTHKRIKCHKDLGLLRCQNRGKTPPRYSPGHKFHGHR